METATCTLKIDNNANHTIPMMRITPAEYVMLNAIHGEGSVIDLKKDKTLPLGQTLKLGDEGDTAISFTGEKERIAYLYLRRSEANAGIWDKLFPGHNPRIPTKFTEVGVNINKETKRAESHKNVDLSLDEVSEEELEAMTQPAAA